VSEKSLRQQKPAQLLRILGGMVLLLATACTGRTATPPEEVPPEDPFPPWNTGSSEPISRSGVVLLRTSSMPILERLSPVATRLGLGEATSGPIEGRAHARDEFRWYEFDGGPSGGVNAVVRRMNRSVRAAPFLENSVLSATPEQLSASSDTLMVWFSNSKGTLVHDDELTSRLLAAMAASTDATAVKLAHSRVFYGAEMFVAHVAASLPGELPVQVCVDLTFAEIDSKHRSVLSHGMARYGREELLVTTEGDDTEVAVQFAWTLSAAALSDPNRTFLDGSTVEGPSGEPIAVRRVPHPERKGADVIRLDL
jgi:hypothetical protein